MQQEKNTLSQQRIDQMNRSQNNQKKQLSPKEIGKISKELVKGWIQEHGDDEESARLFWQTLTRKLYDEGGEQAVKAGIDAHIKKGSPQNAEVMEKELEELIKR